MLAGTPLFFLLSGFVVVCVLIFSLRFLIHVIVRFNNTTNERTFSGHLFGALFWIAVASGARRRFARNLCVRRSPVWRILKGIRTLNRSTAYPRGGAQKSVVAL